jgi:hypothetical protein
MTNPTITIKGTKYVLCDFKTNFSFMQAARATSLLKTIMADKDTTALMNHFGLIGTPDVKGRESELVSLIIKDLVQCGDVFSQAEFLQLFFVFFMPEGIRWNKEYEDTLAARAEELKYDINLWEVIESIKSFFSSPENVSESISTGLPQATSQSAETSS